MGTGIIGASNVKSESRVADQVSVWLQEQKQFFLEEQRALVLQLQGLQNLLKPQEESEKQWTKRLHRSLNNPITKTESFLDSSLSLISWLILLAGLGWIIKLIYMEYKSFRWTTSTDPESERIQGQDECVGDAAPPQTKRLSVSVGEFVQYRMDYYFSSSQFAKPLLLLGITFFIIFLSSLVFMIVQQEDLSDAMWKAWTYVADPGTHADSEGPLGRALGFLTTIAGMMVFALMIGVVSESIGANVDDLKKGKSKVVEKGHTLILGWSEKGLSVLSQIALANKSEGGRPIVVLCSEDKEQMEEMLRVATKRNDDRLYLHGSRVVFRSGNPVNEHDLVKVSAAYARSIIVLSPGGIAPDDADTRLVRQILSLQKIKQSTGCLSGHVVVELQDVDNLAMVQIVGRGDVEVVVSHDLIGRLMLLAARSPWIAPVLTDLMGFDGAEFYLKGWPELVGKRFGDIYYRFENAVPVGLKVQKEQRVVLNPPDDQIIEEGDQVLVLAEDDDTYSVNDCSGEPTNSIPLVPAKILPDALNQPPEKMLFCGWRRDMADMINELDFDVPAGSELWLLNNVPMDQRAIKLLDKGNKSPLRLTNLKIRHVVGNPVVRRDLLLLAEVSDGMQADGLSMGQLTGREEVLRNFTSVMILSDCADGQLDVEASDSRSVATTLTIHEIQRQSRVRMAAAGRLVELPPPVSEILDGRTATLMQLISGGEGCQGYVMSNHLVASALALVSEDRNMNRVYGELLSCKGNQIQIRKARDFIDFVGRTNMSFWDIFRIARVFKELAIGYIPYRPPVKDDDAIGGRHLAISASAKPRDLVGSQVVLNPENKGELRDWHPEDRVVMIGLCRKARVKALWRSARLQAEDELHKTVLVDGIGVPVWGWLKKLGVKKENDMQEESSWRERLCFIKDGGMHYVSEKKKGTYELFCRLDAIRRVEGGNEWPPGHHTFKLFVEPTAEDKRPGLATRIFSAATAEECSTWIRLLAGDKEVNYL